MAKGTLVADQWTRNTIVDVSLEPAQTANGKLAKYGLVKYTQSKNGTVYEWEVRIDSNKKLIRSLEVGKTYDIFLKAIHSGRQTGYDWEIAREVGKAKKLKTADELIRYFDLNFNPELFPPSAKQPEPEPESEVLPDLREDVLALLAMIQQQSMTPEVETLVAILKARMNADKELFAS